MFDDARHTTTDPLGLVLSDFEEWLDDNEYPVIEVSRTGELAFEEPGLAVVAENDQITVGYLAAEGAEPDWRSYLLEELWAMDENELRAEVDDLISSAESVAEA